MLRTYDMEDAAMRFVFDPALQDVWVQDQRFPATRHGRRGRGGQSLRLHDVGLTGRNDAQKAATLGNLEQVGYVGFTGDLYVTTWKSGTVPNDRAWLADTPCADGVCTTIEDKSLTRKHLTDDLGYDIVANFGDQFSDLIGGYADRQVKLPNPTYYLP